MNACPSKFWFNYYLYLYCSKLTVTTFCVVLRLFLLLLLGYWCKICFIFGFKLPLDCVSVSTYALRLYLIFDFKSFYKQSYYLWFYFCFRDSCSWKSDPLTKYQCNDFRVFFNWISTYRLMTILSMLIFVFYFILFANCGFCLLCLLFCL